MCGHSNMMRFSAHITPHTPGRAGMPISPNACFFRAQKNTVRRTGIVKASPAVRHGTLAPLTLHHVRHTALVHRLDKGKPPNGIIASAKKTSAGTRLLKQKSGWRVLCVSRVVRA